MHEKRFKIYELLQFSLYSLTEGDNRHKQYIELLLKDMIEQNIYYQEFRIPHSQDKKHYGIFDYVLENGYQDRLKFIL
jgi:hypothetical protein